MPTAATISPIQPAPRGAQWIDLGTAALRSGRSPGHLRRLCGERWFAQGLARMEKTAGSRPAWFIRDDADPSLARAKFPEQMPIDRSALTPKQRQFLADTEAIVLEYEARRKLGVSAGVKIHQVRRDFIADLRTRGIKISDATIYNYWNAWRSGGLQQLLDKRQSRQAAESAADFTDFDREFDEIYLQTGRPSLISCYNAAAAICRKFEFAARSYSQAKRRVARMRKENLGTLVLNRFGEKAFNDQCLASLKRDYTTLTSNQVWCADHHECDTIVNWHGKLVRPWMTAFEDMRSRKIVAWRIYATDPNSTEIILTFIAGVRESGSPEIVYIDNGKDFDSYALQGQTKAWRMEHRRLKANVDEEHQGGVFGHLQVQVIHAIPYHPQSKPVERFFGTFESQFGKLTRTYCGKDPQSKPEDLWDRLDRGQAPTLEEYAAAAGDYISKLYNEQPHDGQGMDGRPPNSVYSQFLLTKRVMHEADLDFAARIPTKPLKVTKNGVLWSGVNYGHMEPILDGYLGQYVTLHIDPSDITRVAFCDDQNRMVGHLTAQELVPFIATSRQEYAGVVARQKRHNKRIREAAKQHGLRIVRDPLEILIEDRVAGQREKPGATQPDPPNLKPVRSPFNLPSTTDQTMPMRKAVGAENYGSNFSLLSAAEEMEIPNRQVRSAVPSLLSSMVEDD